MSIDILDKIEKKTGLKLDFDIFYDYSTISLLKDYIEEARIINHMLFYKKDLSGHGVRRHIVGGTYRTLISVQNPLRLCRTGICRSLSAG